MTSFSAALLALAQGTNNMSLKSSVLSTYAQAISSSTKALDALVQEASTASPTERANLVSKANQLIFGSESVVTKHDAGYEAQQRQPWFALVAAINIHQSQELTRPGQKPAGSPLPVSLNLEVFSSFK